MSDCPSRSKLPPPIMTLFFFSSLYGRVSCPVLGYHIYFWFFCFLSRTWTSLSLSNFWSMPHSHTTIDTCWLANKAVGSLSSSSRVVLVHTIHYICAQQSLCRGTQIFRFYLISFLVHLLTVTHRHSLTHSPRGHRHRYLTVKYWDFL